jgi:putative flippase GtrA
LTFVISYVRKYKVFLGYVISGIISFTVEFFLFLLFVNFFNYKISNFIAVIIGIIVNYFLSVKYVFKNSRLNKKGVEIIYFIIVVVLSMAINQYSLIYFMEGLKIQIAIGKILSIFVSTFFNFFAKKNFVFKSKSITYKF